MSGIESEISHGGDGVDVEVVKSDDATAEKVDVGVGLENYIQQRKAEHPEWFSDTDTETAQENTEETAEESSEATEEVAAADEREAETPEPEAEPEKPKETESAVLKRVLARERKLRENQKAFEEKEAEFKDKLKAYEKAQKLAKIDPVAYLKTAGVSEEDLIDIAKSLYFESLGDLAPDEYKGQKESLALRREVEELKSKLEAKQEEKEPEPQNQALLSYQQELINAAQSFDVDKFPSVAKVVETYSENDVAADMFRVAQAYAEAQGGMGRPLSPQECLTQVEAHYAKLLGSSQDVEKKSEPVKKTPAKKRTLSNSMSKQQPPTEPVSKDMSYEEVARIARANFFNKLGG